MGLTLTIENETVLPNGGPLSFVVAGRRSVDIGRDPYLDWALPDPTRTISGKHCEIRYRDGGYWLTDVSRNGTFLNRSDQRLQEPYRLRDGDRLEIGRYIISVRVEGEEQAGVPAAPDRASAPASPANYWNASPEAAPPISPRDLRPARDSRPAQADFREWAIDVPAATPPAFSGGGGPVPPSAPVFSDPGDMSWAPAAAAPPPPPAPPPVPSPRRPAAAENAAWQPDPAPLPGLPEAGAGFAPVTPFSAPGSMWDESVATPATSDGASAQPALPLPQMYPPPPLDPIPPAPAPAALHEPSRRPAAAPPSAPGSEMFVACFAKGAGVPPETFAGRDPGDLAEEFGELLRLSAENLKQLLTARAETKRLARTGGQTMIQTLDNNPLKFSPTIEDALRIMFGRPSSGYLDARRALDQGFRDLKTHQVKTYSAMQHALRLLMEELDPEAVARSTEGDRGLSLLASKKAKLWDLYVARWNALAAPHEDGMVDAFMVFFAECYDRGGKA